MLFLCPVYAGVQICALTGIGLRTARGPDRKRRITNVQYKQDPRAWA